MPGRKIPEEQRREEILRAAYHVAARERLTGLTIQAVADEAGVSKGLVFFHFGSRDTLLAELLDWLLRTTLAGPELPDLLGGASPVERLLAAVRRDLEYLPRRRARVELFFDYWVIGTRHPGIRRTIRTALDRYRDAYLPLTAAVVDAEPERYAGLGAHAVAAVVAAFVEGCALRAVLDPQHFEVETFLRGVETLVARPVPLAAGDRGTLSDS